MNKTDCIECQDIVKAPQGCRTDMCSQIIINPPYIMSTKTITIDGKEYVPKGTAHAKTFKGKKYVIVRTYSAGVFAGYLDKRKGQEVILLDARRIWKWEGAASLSELAMQGTSKPIECKFPQEVDKVELLNVIEILDTTKKAQESINSVPIWTHHK